MSRYNGRFQCAGPGCREVAWHEYDTRKEQSESYARNKTNPWKCSRHRDPEHNLRHDNTSTTITLVASKVPFGDGFLEGLFWEDPTRPHGSSGYSFGPGFNAHASDFPEGTKLTVETRIEMPS